MKSNYTKLLKKLMQVNNFRLFDLSTPEVNLLDNQLENIKNLTVIRSNQLYIELNQLTAKQIMALRWSASFFNPEYFQRQRQRLSTWDTPQYVSLAEKHDNYMGLPRGLEKQLVTQIPNLTIIDETNDGHVIDATFKGELRADQKEALNELMKDNMGVLAARTGFGKTVISADLISQRKCSTLIVVNKKDLATQWKQRLTEFLKIKGEPFVEFTPTGRKKKKDQIGTIYAGKKLASQLVDIATVQTLSKMENLESFLDAYGMIIIDEVHHIAAITFDQVVMKSKARYIYGLSATPYRRDRFDPIIFMRAGEIAYQTEKYDEKQLMNIQRKLIPRITKLGQLNSNEISENGIHGNYEAIINSADRTEMIVHDIIDNYHNGKHQLVLTQRIKHIEVLYNAIPEDITVYTLSGNQRSKENSEIISNCKDPYVILATGSLVGEGFDVKPIDTMLLAMPISWKGSTEQYVGRISRGLEDKNELIVFDYVDLFVPMLAKMYQKRLKTYRALQYEIIDVQNSNERIFDEADGTEKLIEDLDGIVKSLQVSIYKMNNKLRNMINNANVQEMKLVLPTGADSSSLKGLNENNIEIKERQRVANILIINHKVIWYGIDQIMYNKKDGFAMRFESSDLAEEFEKTIDGTDLFKNYD